MDWGLARVVDSKEENSKSSFSSNESISHTIEGAIIGTPAYMAPEQARGEAVDARADVFALGGILAVILTGKPTFKSSNVRHAVEMAAAGNTEDVIDRLSNCQADNELVSIAKKCLNLDPIARPESGDEVAKLIAKYRESVDERLKRAEMERVALKAKSEELVKRQRVKRIATITVIIVLLLGVVGTSIGLFKADIARRSESRRAESESKAKIKASELAESEKKANAQTQKRLQQILNSNQILTDVFRDLDIDLVSLEDRPLESILAERLVSAGKSLKNELVGDPLAVAKMQHRLGESLMSLGYPQDAIELFNSSLQTQENELGSDHKDTLQTNFYLAKCHIKVGKRVLATQMFEDLLLQSREIHGEKNDLTLRVMYQLSRCYLLEGEIRKAFLQIEQAYQMRLAINGKEDFETLICMNLLGEAYRAKDELDTAAELLEEQLVLMEALVGAQNIATINSIAALAGTKMDQGDFEKSEELYQRLTDIRKSKYGADHPRTLTAMSNLALVYQKRGEYKKAIELSELALELKRTENMGPIIHQR